MRNEEAQAKRASKNCLVGAVMDLALVAGAVLSMGSAPTKHATSPSSPPGPRPPRPSPPRRISISPGEANADSDSLDLQLD